MQFLAAGIILVAALFFSSRARGEETPVTVIQNDNETPAPEVTGSPQTIAVANNNPLNIRETNDDWDGLATPRAKKGFFNFISPKWGFRAAAKIILITYQNRYGIDKLGDVIRRWAPPEDNNDTPNYIAYVVKRTGLPAVTRLDKSNIVEVLAAMARLESGKEWNKTDIKAGVDAI